MSDTSGKTPRDDGLSVGLVDGKLVISIGIDTLAFACEFGNPENSGDSFYISDADEFAKEMVNMLEAEEEDGSTLIHRLFDNATNEILEQGGLGIELREEQ